MTVLQDLRAISRDMGVEELLKHLLTERFPGRVAVSASLRARSVLVLSFIADVDPATPVIFCHAGTLYPESREYRDQIVERLGLTDVRVPGGNEAPVMPGDLDHVEWAYETLPGGGRVQNAIHLNRALENFDCWISAVYHRPADPSERRRIDRVGRLIRFNPLLKWDRERVHETMRARGIPFHRLAVPAPARRSNGETGAPVPSYSY